MSDRTSRLRAERSEQPTAAPGYYPDPSVPGFVRYWNGGGWVPGTSRPAPADGEVLAAPRFADRVAPRPGGRYVPPPAVPVPVAAESESEETGPVFLDETGAGAVLTLGPDAGGGMGVGVGGDVGSRVGGWHADPQEQRGLLETGRAPRVVSWGVAEGGQGALVVECATDAVAVSASAAPLAATVPLASAVPAVVSGGSVPGGSVPVPRKSAGPTSRAAEPALTVTRTTRAPAAVARTGAARPALEPARFRRRLLARLLDTLPLLAVGAAVGVPLAVRTTAYLQQKLDQARTVSQLTRREVDVWLIDGTVLGRVALVLGAVLLAGVLLEVVPTARTGRTLGKRLLGLRVVRTGTGQAPGAGRACGRWLVAHLLLLTVLGLAGAAAWPDRLARTTVVRG
ncbi:RDD family protein [Kitasatospora viridis]